MLDDLQLDQISDPHDQTVIRRRLNLVETLSAEVDRLKAENQHLRDEINRLKEMLGRPKNPRIRPPVHAICSEAEQRVPRGRVKGSKNEHLRINREKL